MAMVVPREFHEVADLASNGTLVCRALVSSMYWSMAPGSSLDIGTSHVDGDGVACGYQTAW